MPKSMLEKLSEGRVYRSMTMRALEPESDQEPSYTVEGYATTFDQPYTLYSDPQYKIIEVVSRDAFAATDMSDVIMQYDHTGRVFARLSNETLDLELDDHGLKVRAFLGGTEIGRQLYEEIRGGYTNKMSFGFKIRDRKESREDTDDGIIVTSVITDISKLYDVSAVSLPANDTTEISARSYCEGVIAELEQEKLEAERIAAEKAKVLARIRIH